MTALAHPRLDILRVLREAADPMIVPVLRARIEKRGRKVSNDLLLFALADLVSDRLVERSREHDDGKWLYSLTPDGAAALDAAMRDQVARDLTAGGKTEMVVEIPHAVLHYPGTANAAGMSEEVLLAVRGYELAWFAEHPDERSFIRRLVPGEFPPDVAAEWVRVTRLDGPANRRQREPIVKVGDTWEDWKAPSTP